MPGGRQQGPIRLARRLRVGRVERQPARESPVQARFAIAGRQRTAHLLHFADAQEQVSGASSSAALDCARAASGAMPPDGPSCVAMRALLHRPDRPGGDCSLTTARRVRHPLLPPLIGEASQPIRIARQFGGEQIQFLFTLPVINATWMLSSSPGASVGRSSRNQASPTSASSSSAITRRRRSGRSISQPSGRPCTCSGGKTFVQHFHV